MRIPELQGHVRRDGETSSGTDGTLLVRLVRRKESKKSFYYVRCSVSYSSEYLYFLEKRPLFPEFRLQIPALQAVFVSILTLQKIAIIVLAILTILIALFLVTNRLKKNKLRSAYTSRNAQTQSSQDKLPSLFSWKSLFRRQRPRRTKYSSTLQDNELERNESREMSGGALADPERPSATATTLGNGSNRDSAISGVDRNTSVRSVMTLPAYAPTPRESEQILAREGERGGIDTVIEFPEAAEEEEARREGEMESLYQIRLARRREAAEREERRQARREARARGDMQALAEIRQRAEAAAEESLSQVLIAEHQGANRDRRVSSVQYGDLGLARHDGTRLRANSSESDNRPLLDSAASISGQSARSRAFSTTNTLNTHYRGPSVSSVISSRASDDFEFTDAAHTRSNSATRTHGSPDDDFEVVSLAHPHSHSTSRVATPSLGGSPSIEIPREDAPAYEDPPNYESPVRTRAPQLPWLEPLPSIQVTTEPTPVEGRVRSFDLERR